jgi:poly(3-hydroxyalkanoate) synthetase
MNPGDRQKQKDSPVIPQSPVISLLWPLLAAASATAATASFFADFAKSATDVAGTPAPMWVSPNQVRLELASMRLRDFSTQSDGTPVVLCAPYALHEATVADFAPGYSIVEVLRSVGHDRLFVTDWRSATPDMRYFSIDSYLADLNIAVDETKPPVDLVGLCQGGWLALIYAARFPEKVRRLVLVGAPVDTYAGQSSLSRTVRGAPISAFETLVQLGQGRVLGKHVIESWGAFLAGNDTQNTLQLPPDFDVARYRELDERFQAWNAATVDLPGTYYLQVINRLYKENQIAEGRFIALGRRINLADVKVPIFLLAARDDELVAPEQLLVTAQLVGTSKAFIDMETEPCRHLSLFIGRKTLVGTWRRIAQWLSSDLSSAKAS